MTRNARRSSFRWSEAARIGFLTAFTSFVVVLPFWVLFINSAKTQTEASSLGLGLPSEWHLLSNYKQVIEEGRVISATLNTLALVLPSIAIITFLASSAAWVFARRASRWSSAAYAFCISGVLLPPMIITTILVLQKLHLYGGFAGAILFYVGAFSAIAIFLITGFVRNIPIEIEEAARIDGAGPFGVYWHIILPLLRPVMFTSAVFLFLFIWSDLLYQFFLVGGRGHDTLSIGLYNFAQRRQYETAWNLVFADVVLVSFVPLLVFFVAQKRILSGLTAGALNR